MATLEDYFSFQVFLIVLRETLESAIIVSVLLAFLHQSFITPHNAYSRLGSEEIDTDFSDDGGTASTVEGSSVVMEESSVVVEGSSVDPPEAVPDESLSIYKYLRLQVWIGGFLGLVCCLILGSVILSIFYVIGNDLWAVTEHYWEGTFSIVASIIISVMGIKILRVNKMQEKWKAKLTTIIKKSNYLNRVVAGQKGSFGESVDTFSEKYSMFILPFITTLREGMEAIVFIGGIGINENTSVASIVISTFTAIIIGSIIGILLYRTGNSLSLQWFLMCSTGLLYLIAAGLFSKGVWNFELQKFIDRCDGFDVSETGHGPGSYDITKSVWHVNCCNGELQDDGAFWMIATAVLGWTNSATYGSIFSYLGYWVAISCVFTSLVFEERHGYLPVIPVKLQKRRIKKKLLANQMIYNSVARDSLDSTSGLMA